MTSAAMFPSVEWGESVALERREVDGECVVTFGDTVLFRFDRSDVGMRNMAVVALTDAGVKRTDVADCFGITATYVSMLRGRARREGSAGLVRRIGRPSKLTDRQAAQARRWRSERMSQSEIAERLHVDQSAISRLLAKVPVQEPLGLAEATSEPGPKPEVVAEAELEPALEVEAEPDAEPALETEAEAEPEPEAVPEPEVEPELEAEAAFEVGFGAVAQGVRSSRYAGAMLLWPFLERVGMAEVFASVTDGPSRRYDTLAVLATALFGFALGADSLEGVKGLARSDAGALVGTAKIPELRTLRGRLGAIADRADPLALHRDLTRGLLKVEPAALDVFFVDDHFVAYSGARPVAKGWNTRRRHAEAGRDDTFVVDLAGRPICFASGEPSGLSKTMPPVIAELRAICGPQVRPLIGFDRGGAYPVCFAALRDAGCDWVTYRRGDPAAVTATARLSWFNLDGRRHSYRIADETVDIKGYGPARQLTVFENGEAAFQVLTSVTDATPARMVHLLRCRWRIENTFKYLVAHRGIDWLCDYTMHLQPDDRIVDNPARKAANTEMRDAEAALSAAKQALGHTLAADVPYDGKLAAIGRLRDDVAIAVDDVADKRAALKTIRAKVPATTIDPNAQRAMPRLQRRALQMVLRLLAENAEGSLARRLNTYLADPDEYRTITRNLLHLAGTIQYDTHTVTVTLERPDQPRVARALTHLCDELNTTPTHHAGDKRPITYQIAAP